MQEERAMRRGERPPEQSRTKHLPAASLLEPRRLRRFKHNMFLLVALLLIGTLVTFALSSRFTLPNEHESDSAQTNTAEQAFPFVISRGHFSEYPLPRQDSEVMPPAIDDEGRLWFGEMGQNALAVFDPRSRSFQQITPPHGHYSIMGVQIAADDTIWFAEQDANYIGHYFPKTRHFQLYPLPRVQQTTPNDTGQSLLLRSAPNELAFDRHGNLWFTEVNADSLGWLDTHSGRMRHYPLAKSHSVQKLAPYGLTLDPEGDIWFTEANSNQFGRFDPSTGQMRFFSWPGSQTPFKEIASDGQGRLYLTTFTSNLLLGFDPRTDTFTPFYAPSPSNRTGSGYGLPDLAIASSGDVWVTDPAANALLRLDTVTHGFTAYPIPTPASLPLGIVMAANQALWFTEIQKIGMLQL